jgi:hypothetical protein
MKNEANFWGRAKGRGAGWGRGTRMTAQLPSIISQSPDVALRRQLALPGPAKELSDQDKQHANDNRSRFDKLPPLYLGSESERLDGKDADTANDKPVCKPQPTSGGRREGAGDDADKHCNRDPGHSKPGPQAELTHGQARAWPTARKLTTTATNVPKTKPAKNRRRRSFRTEMLGFSMSARRQSVGE